MPRQSLPATVLAALVAFLTAAAAPAAAEGLNPAAAAAAAERPADPGVSPEIIDMMADAVIAKLRARPEVLLDIILTYEERQRARQAMIRPEDPVSGAADGDVTVVEFFDPACVPCRTTAAALDAAAAADPKLKVVHKDFPTTAAGIALSLDALGGDYAAARKAIIEGRTPPAADAAGRAKAAAILAADREAAAKAKVTALPTLFVVGGGRAERIEGPATAAQIEARVAALRPAAPARP